MRASNGVLIAALALAACGPKASTGNAAAPTPAAASASDEGGHLPADFARLPMKEFMGHVMQFTANQFWKWQGFINDEKGERSLYPKTDEEWEEAESGALTLAEMTNVLLMPGRRIDDPRWDKAVAGVRALALQGAQAAEKHDKDGLFKVGGALDEACDDCHKQFIPNFVGPPSDSAGAPPTKTS
jgi:hypothetical protein